MVGEYLLGPGALAHLARVFAGRADAADDRVLYLVDHFFHEPGHALPLAV